MGGGVLSLDLTSESGQAVQQAGLFFTRGAANGLGQFSQFALGVSQHSASCLSSRKSEQRGHAVALNFQQLLDQASQLTRRQPIREQHNAREAIRVQLEIGVDAGVIIRHA